MNKIKKQQKAIDFQEHLAERLKNKKFKKYFDEYGIKLKKQYERIK